MEKIGVFIDQQQQQKDKLLAMLNNRKNTYILKNTDLSCNISLSHISFRALTMLVNFP